jgi:hypothetical protein
MSRAIIIAGALIAAAILIREGWTQATVTPFTTGIVTTACSATVPPFTTGKFNYAVGSQAPITLNPGGQVCTSL